MARNVQGPNWIRAPQCACTIVRSKYVAISNVWERYRRLQMLHEFLKQKLETFSGLFRLNQVRIAGKGYQILANRSSKCADPFGELRRLTAFWPGSIFRWTVFSRKILRMKFNPVLQIVAVHSVVVFNSKVMFWRFNLEVLGNSSPFEGFDRVRGRL